jgi:hypothetical protein
MNTKTLSTYLLSSLTLVSLVFLAACSPPVALAQPNTVEVFEEDTSRSWEMDADDIAAAREAAESLSQIYTADVEYLGEDDFQRSWEIGVDDIAAAREAALALAQFSTVGEVDFDATELVSGELNASDISTARQAVHYLAATERVSHEINPVDISAARQAAYYLAAAERVSHEISLVDISDARQAAQTLAHVR